MNREKVVSKAICEESGNREPTRNRQFVPGERFLGIAFPESHRRDNCLLLQGFAHTDRFEDAARAPPSSNARSYLSKFRPRLVEVHEQLFRADIFLENQSKRKSPDAATTVQE